MKDGFQKLEKNDGDSTASEEEVLPVRITYLTPALVEEAKLQLGETEETRAKALHELRKKIEADSKLSTLTDDLFLLAFLRSRKFNVKKAFKLLQNYWSFRKEYESIYDLAESEPVLEIIARSYMGFLPHRDRNGCTVMVAKFALWDPEVDTYENIFRAVSAILVYSLEHEATQIAGFRAIMDIRGIGMKQLRYFTPSNILLLIKSTQFCFPSRYKGIHILSSNKMLNFIWMMISPFLTSKLKKRIFFHGEDLTPLLQYIHPSVLPEEFGGRGPPFDNTDWMEVVQDRVESVREHLKYGYKN